MIERHYEAAEAALVGAVYLVLTLCVVVPRIRARTLSTNKRAMAAAAVFLSGAVERGLAAVRFTASRGDDADGSVSALLILWEALPALLIVFYLLRRLWLGRPSPIAPLFDDPGEREVRSARGAFRAESVARAEAEGQRDFNVALMRSINRHSEAMIYVKDLDGRYLLVNEACEKAFGVSESEAIGRTADVIDPAMADHWRAIDLAARDGFLRVEQQVQLDENERYLDISSFPVLDGAGELCATCSIAVDVTQQKLAVGELAETRDRALEAAAAKSTFLATMSHEIRTPMNAVIGMTDLLTDTPLTAEQQEFLSTIRISGDALLAVISDILDFSKIESGKLGLNPTTFNLRDQIEGCLDLVAAVASAKGLDLVSYVDDSCPALVLGDADRIRQILLNLLSNAVKFTDAGEVLVTVTTSPADEHVLLSIDVTDTGIGISPDAALKLFKSFSQVESSSTRSHGGTGLGLVISQRLAQAMGGDISATSTAGRGSTFTVSLELERAAADAVGEYRPGPEATLQGVSVLVVDDNATNLRILDLQLTSLGMVCTTEMTPELALAALAAGTRFDIAVLDLHMPGMSGLELATAIRATPSGAQTPVVLLTSVSGRTVRPIDNIRAVLTKPVKSKALHAALSSVLTARAPSYLHPPDVQPQHGQGSGQSDRGYDLRQAAVEGAPGGRLRVLLVEDNLINQKVAQLMLDKIGHSVDAVVNGVEALDAIRRARYDVVLMDVQMPEMDGLEATRRIRAELPPQAQPLIIAMTANALTEDRQACTEAGMDSYLAKPVRVADLRTILGDAGASIRDFDPGHPEFPLERMLQPEQVAVRLGAAAPLPVDVFVIDKLREKLDDPDDTAFAALVNAYVLDGAVTVTELATAVAGGDLAGVRTIAHSWSSSSRLLGATTLAALLARAEVAAEESPAELPSLAVAILTEHSRVAASLELLSPERVRQDGG